MLLFSGVAVLGYAAFEYGTMLLEQRHLQALWRAQQRPGPAVSHRTIAFRGDSFVRISIPSIQFSAVVVEGTDFYSLLIAPGHLPGTPQPGEAGNAVISGHRDTFFRNIVGLNPGDHILVERDGRTFTYVVDGFRIVKPTDISVIAPTNDNRLTLITCNPANYPGPAPQRLVVISKLISTDASPSDVSVPHQDQALPHMERAAIRKPDVRGKR